jgi:hypothetical protein
MNAGTNYPPSNLLASYIFSYVMYKGRGSDLKPPGKFIAHNHTKAKECSRLFIVKADVTMN